MKALNKAQLIGYLGKDPELRHTQNNQAWCNFTVATNESWVDKSTGELKERTEWHNIVCWARLAEIAAQYARRGHRIYIEGKIQSREYVDKEGITRKAFEIVANDLLLLDPRGQADAGSSQQALQHHPSAERRPAADTAPRAAAPPWIPPLPSAPPPAAPGDDDVCPF